VPACDAVHSVGVRFSLCLALSLVLHALVLEGLQPFFGVSDPGTTLIEARLVKTEPHKPSPQSTAPPPTRKAAPRPVTAPPSSRAAPVRIPEPLPSTAGETMPDEEPQPAEPVAAPEPPQPAEAPAVAETAPELPQPEPVAATPAMDAVRDLPRSGSISYDLFIGSNRFSIGRTVQSWEIRPQRYRLSSFSETTGLVGLFRPYQLGYETEGQVGAGGLRPESFSVRRGRNGARQYAVRFDWSAKELTLGPIAAPRKVALADGTLDLLTFIYQLARTALVPGRIQVNVTTGNKLEVYTLEIGAEEIIDLPLGTLRTIPIRQMRKPGQESIEIWLSPEHAFLPVRVRFLDREGNLAGEQLAANIAIDAG
jgi:hypothetical protein